MPHPLVDQLKFTRSQWLTGFEGVSAREAVKRFEPLNCLSWMVGHLAYHEYRNWVQMAQGLDIAPELEAWAWGEPASTPPLQEMWAAWQRVTKAADRYLDTLTSEHLQTHLTWQSEPLSENIGTLLIRNIYHYWFHLGEAQAVRQLLGHRQLPGYVGQIPPEAQYRPES